MCIYSTVGGRGGQRSGNEEGIGTRKEGKDFRKGDFEVKRNRENREMSDDGGERIRTKGNWHQSMRNVMMERKIKEGWR